MFEQVAKEWSLEYGNIFDEWDKWPFSAIDGRIFLFMSTLCRYFLPLFLCFFFGWEFSAKLRYLQKTLHFSLSTFVLYKSAVIRMWPEWLKRESQTTLLLSSSKDHLSKWLFFQQTFCFQEHATKLSVTLVRGCTDGADGSFYSRILPSLSALLSPFPVLTHPITRHFCPQLSTLYYMKIGRMKVGKEVLSKPDKFGIWDWVNVTYFNVDLVAAYSGSTLRLPDVKRRKGFSSGLAAVAVSFTSCRENLSCEVIALEMEGALDGFLIVWKSTHISCRLDQDRTWVHEFTRHTNCHSLTLVSAYWTARCWQKWHLM